MALIPSNFNNYSNIAREKLYETQLNELRNKVLLDDSEVSHKFLSINPKFPLITGVTFINAGEVVAGSSMAKMANTSIQANDIDIYFHSKQDVLAFLVANKWSYNLSDLEKAQMCIRHGDYNLIFDIPFTTPESLISKFDIRACAIAYKPSENRAVWVEGAPEDAVNKVIHFLTSPRSVSIHRLLKYIEKDFKIDKYQRVIFAELIKLGYHDSDLELTTGY